MPKEKKGQNPSKYLQDLEEWQENQYNPGYYIGGRIPPQLKYNLGKKSGKMLGVILLLFGLFSTVPTIISIKQGNGNIILNLFFSIVPMAAGLRFIFAKANRK